MRRGAQELEQQAERLRSCGESVSAEVHQMWWLGPDADKFRTIWEQSHRRIGEQVASELHRLAARLRQEAARQEGVSMS